MDSKKKESEELARLLKEFKKNGGKITKLDPGEMISHEEKERHREKRKLKVEPLD